MVIEKLGMNLRDMSLRVYERFCLVDILKIGLQLINIVEKLHEIGYIHRDIKPDNILIGDFSSILKDNQINNITIND